MNNLRKIMKEAEAVLELGSDRLNPDQIEALKSRLQSGAAHLRDSYEDMEDRVKEYYTDIEERVTDYCNELENHVKSGIRTTDHSIRSRPYQAVAVAFAAGMVVGGFLLSRK